MQQEATKNNYAAPNRKLWVYGLLGATILASLAYYALLSQKDRSINHDYYRVLYEASNTFNENLIKLDSMHQYKESVSSIRSLMPSYSRIQQTIQQTKNSEPNTSEQLDFQYEVIGTSLIVTSPKTENFKAQLTIDDILPKPKKGFSQYLFANENEVLAMVGAERTISIVDLESINKQIQIKNKQFQFRFSDPKIAGTQNSTVPLPSYSNHVDMKISYGEFRVYIFPFTLRTPLHQKGQSGKSDPIERLYLVGLLPQSKLDSRDSGDWNISLLIVTLASLFFLWSMLRLFLLPKNQSITKSFRALVASSTYLFFIIIIALVLSYFQKTVLQTKKDSLALQYAHNIEESLAKDVNEVFSELSRFRTFYHKLISTIYAMPKEKKGEAFFPEAVDNFNAGVKSAILSLDSSPCKMDDTKNELKLSDHMPGKAGSALQQYDITYNCEMLSSDDNFLQVSLDSEAISIIIDSSQSTSAGQGTLDFYANNQSTNLVKGKSLETSIDPKFNLHTPNKILSVFALNREGNSVLPSMNYQEGNSLPETFDLSHRDYYKMVRDHKGWNITIGPEYLSQTTNKAKTFNNVYMQRLLNINNGTRGTTISMPIVEPSLQPSQTRALDYIIGADVLMPSLSLGASPPYDFVYMVVDRSSGEVLFHNDSNRSLVENLYFSGDNRSALSKWLKAGLDHYKELSDGLIAGTYHGQDGRFAVSKTIVDKWAVVVFYPNDSLQTFMTNQFLYIATTFVSIICIMILVLYLIRQYVWTSALKQKLNLPSKLNVRLTMLVSSLLFATGYCFYIIGYTLQKLVYLDPKWVISLFPTLSFNVLLLVSFLGIVMATIAVYRACINHFCYPLSQSDDATNSQSISSAKQGAKKLIGVVLLAVVLHFVYLQKTADAPHKSLDFHYQQLACNWINYEREELTSIALSRYPNSVTSTRISPLDLLPIDENWRKELKRVDREPVNDDPQSLGNRCSNHSTQVHPDDYPRLSSVFGATHLWKWITIYILDREFGVDYVPFNNVIIEENNAKTLFSKLLRQTLLFSILLGVIVIMWFRFNTRLVWRKLYCGERFLKHIHIMNQSLQDKHQEEPDQSLVIECDTIKRNGIGLALLLRTMSFGKDKAANKLLDRFNELYELSPCLQKFSADNHFLPNLKLNISKPEQNQGLSVEIWDIETCLEKSKFRPLLLDLIMELKSLTLSKQLASFTIFTGFHSLQRVKIKESLLFDQNSLLDQSDYLSWAECLMDFIVKIPNSFAQGVDWDLLREELAGFPELAFICKQVTQKSSTDGWDDVFKHNRDMSSQSRWATINYILLHAETLYRFKWELCSSAEKLALINLAKQQRINPANTQMIEHLALNGLVTVRKGHLDIINRSFAHFVLHAENAETLNRLIAHGEAGVWKNYKLPIGILIVLVIGGIALTSGESVYIIAASLAGILGTIGSVASSTNMLRGQIQE